MINDHVAAITRKPFDIFRGYGSVGDGLEEQKYKRVCTFLSYGHFHAITRHFANTSQLLPSK